jgi:hypothetical protein
MRAFAGGYATGAGLADASLFLNFVDSERRRGECSMTTTFAIRLSSRKGAGALVALASLFTRTPGAAAQQVDSSSEAPPPSGERPSPAAEMPMSAPVAPRAFRGRPSRAAPIDLCAHKPGKANGRYQRQRVLLFNPLVAPSAVAPEQEVTADGKALPITHEMLASVHADEIARIVVGTEFPMARFFLVTTPEPPDPKLLTRPTLTYEALAQSANGEAFIQYSAACADWVAIPHIQRTSASWKKVQREKIVVEDGKERKIPYLAWELSLGWKVELHVYARAENHFERATTLVGGTGLAGVAAAGASAEQTTLAYREYASVWPDAACGVGPARDGTATGVGRCGGLEPELSHVLNHVRLPSPGSCAGDNDAVDAGPDARREYARCEVLRSLHAATRHLQREARRYEPWTLFTSLLATAPDAYAIDLGAEDGVKRGDYYVADSVDARGERVTLGFARVVRLGRGGSAGARDPSSVKFKSGEAPPGSRMSEYALMGVQVGLRPGVLYLLAGGDLETSLAYGGAVNVGYDVSRIIPLFDEVWLRGNVGYFVGAEDESFLNVDVAPEAMSYLGGGLAYGLSAGLSALVPNVRVSTGSSETEQTWSGSSIGVLARASLEYAFGPDWSASLAVEGRTGLSSTSLENDASTLKIDAGSLMAGLAFLNVGHTF